MARIAMPLGEGFEDSEFAVPREKLRQAGHEVVVFGVRANQKLTGKRRAVEATTDASAADLQASDFDALVIPGGYSPDHLRLDQDVVRFVRDFTRSGKPVAAICHGPQLLIEADSVRGRTVTSWPSVRKDLENAGASWVDRPVVVDDDLITSRKPEDLKMFCDAVLASLAENVGAADQST
jgi:protease I